MTAILDVQPLKLEESQITATLELSTGDGLVYLLKNQKDAIYLLNSRSFR